MSNPPSLEVALQELLAATRRGEAAWQRSVAAGEGLPRRADDAAPFRGISALLLWQRLLRSRMIAWRRVEAEAADGPMTWLPDGKGGRRWVGEIGSHLESVALPSVAIQDVRAVVAKVCASFGRWAVPLESLAVVLAAARFRVGVDALNRPLDFANVADLCEQADTAQLMADLAVWELAPRGVRRSLLDAELRTCWRVDSTARIDWGRLLSRTLDKLAFATQNDGRLSGPATWAQALGKAAAVALATGGSPPAPLVEGARRWQRLWRKHLVATWPHQWPRVHYSELVRDSRWDGVRLARMLYRARRGSQHANTPLRDLPCALIGIDRALAALSQPRVMRSEEEWLAAMSKAAKLSVEPTSWSVLLAHLQPEQAYARHPIPRASGGLRWLDVPAAPLGAVQQVCARLLVAMTPSNGAITAFMRYRGPAAHAMAHQDARALVSVDIRDFFGSVRPANLRPWLQRRGEEPFGGGLGTWSADGLAALVDLLFVSREGVPRYLPQGSPSSPAAANLAAVALDALVRRAARKKWGIEGFSYTRYADDLVLSLRRSDVVPEAFLEEALDLMQAALATSGWVVNPSKTQQWMPSMGRLPTLCGVRPGSAVEESVQVSRDARRRGRAARHRLASDQHDPEASGTVSWLYSATGHPGWTAWTGAGVGLLAREAVGRLLERDFRLGWDQSLDDEG